MPEWLRAWLPLLVPLMTVAVIPFAAWLIRTGLVPRREYEIALAAEAASRRVAIEGLDRRLTETIASVDRRTLHIEAELEHMPTIEDMSEVKAKLADVDAQSKATAKTVDQVQLTVNRIADHLLNAKGK